MTARNSRHPTILAKCPDPFGRGCNTSSHVAGDLFYDKARYLTFSHVDNPCLPIYIAFMLVADYAAGESQHSLQA